MFLVFGILSPLVMIMRMLANLLNLPMEKYGFVAAGFILLLLALAAGQIVPACKARKVHLRQVVAVALVCIFVCKLIPYVDSRTKTVTPELVATLEVEDMGEPPVEVYTYFSVSRWPFTLESTLSPTRSYTSADEKDWILENTPSTGEYTYIISYGHEILALHYNVWSGSDLLPAPWNGATPATEFETGTESNAVYIYRIDALPLDTHP